MALAIYKYTLGELDDEVTILMPRDATLFHVGEQAGNLTIWAGVNTEKSLVKRAIRIVGTGHPIDDFSGFIGTVQMLNGLVWHVFDREGIV